MDIEVSAASKIRQHYLFASLSDAQWERLSGRIGLVRLGMKEILFRRGEQANHFFMVGDGHIKLSLLSREGHQKVVEVMGPGQTFAEAVMFMELQQFPVNAEALESSVVYSFPNADFISILQDSTETCFRLLADVCKRLHGRLIEIENLTVQNATHRLVRYLVEQLPAGCKDTASFEFELSRQVIAARLSIQPETLSRLLKNLVSSGILAVEGKRVHVHSVDRLKAFQ